MMSITRMGLTFGESKEEPAHTVLLSLLNTGFSSKMAALQRVDAVLEEA